MSNVAESQYVIRTRQAYQDQEVAERYRNYHTRGITWIRLTMWRQSRIVAGLLRRLLAHEKGLVLDVPCGTGLLGSVFKEVGARVLAADMSAEMIRLARKDYDRDFTVGFARWDITSMPLEKDAAVGIVILGLFHRLPQEVRLRAIEEMSRVSRRWAIVSFTEDNPFHRVKRRILRLVYPGYKGAPCPWSLAELISEIEAGGFKLASQYMTIPWLSSEIVCLFERRS